MSAKIQLSLRQLREQLKEQLKQMGFDPETAYEEETWQAFLEDTVVEQIGNKFAV